jgi:hypothetical protein
MMIEIGQRRNMHACTRTTSRLRRKNTTVTWSKCSFFLPQHHALSLTKSWSTAVHVISDAIVVDSYAFLYKDVIYASACTCYTQRATRHLGIGSLWLSMRPCRRCALRIGLLGYLQLLMVYSWVKP